MPNQTIDLRKLRKDLKGGLDPEHELPKPEAAEEKLLMTEGNAHPQGFLDEPERGAVLLEWNALEFERDPNRMMLLFLFGGLLLAGAILSFIFVNLLLGLLLLLAGGLALSQASRKPREIQFAITSRGVQIQKHLYEFHNLESFWIFYDPPLWKDLSLQSKKTFVPFLRLPLGDTDPLPIREILLRFLPEVEHEETLMDIVAKHLGL